MKEWKSKAFEAAILLLVVAIVGRLVWGFMQPLVPVLVTLIGLGAVYSLIFRDRH